MQKRDRKLQKKYKKEGMWSLRLSHTCLMEPEEALEMEGERRSRRRCRALSQINETNSQISGAQSRMR